MNLSYMTSAAFNQNPSRAKRQADEQPVVITDHGKARYVLMRYSDFEQRMKPFRSLAEALNDPRPEADKDFEPARLRFPKRDLDL